MKIALIVNPCSGGKKGRTVLSQVENILSLNGIDYHIHVSQYHNHLQQIASDLDIKKYDAVVVMGGDGTNFHVLNGLLSKFEPRDIPPVGIIPVGSGNSFARDLNIYSLEDGIRSILEKKSKWIDVCSFTQLENTFYFVNLLGAGFVTDVAQTAAKFKIFKDFSYIIGVLCQAASLDCPYMEFEIDGKVIAGNFCFFECCNSKYTGGGMLMAPDAKINDGLMDIIIAGKFSRINLLATLPRIFTGTHIQVPLIRHFKARQVKIKTCPDKTLLPDGEIFGKTPTTIKVHHKMVRYLS